MLAGDSLRARCCSQGQLFSGQVLLAVHPMLGTWCGCHFPPPRLDNMSRPQLSPLSGAGTFLPATVVLRRLSHPTQQGRPPRCMQQEPPAAEPKPAAKEMHRPAPQWQEEYMKSFSLNFCRNDPCSSPGLAFYLQQVLQVPAGSGIAFVWESCGYTLSGYFYTSDGVDSIW